MDDPRPIEIPGLWWSITPITWEQAGLSAENVDPKCPCTQVDYYQAEELAVKLGGRLPSSVEWEWMAAGPERRLYPWGQTPWSAEKANLLPSATGVAVVVGGFPKGATPDGMLDVAGNVWEWASSAVWDGGAIIKGGSYNSKVLYAITYFLNSAPKELRSPGIGFRVIRTDERGHSRLFTP